MKINIIKKDSKIKLTFMEICDKIKIKKNKNRKRKEVIE